MPQRTRADMLPDIIRTRSIRRPNGCWEWTWSKFSEGYGNLRVNGKTLMAHRVSYEVFVGPIPEGLVIDHLCRNRACVNPEHMEPVTDAVNVLRGVGPSAVNARKTHCSNGHPLSGDNVAMRRGRRDCLTCRPKR